MKFVVVSNKTIERAIVENSILGDMKSDKEKELEKKQKDELEKKKKEELDKKTNNDNVIVKPPETKPPETKEKPPETKEKPPETKEKPPETKEKPPETKEKPPETKEKPPETKEKPPENKTPEIKTPEIKTPPKPTNPSGKIIPKPKKPLMKNSPAAKAGIPTETRQKISNMNAAFQATKDKNSGYTKMDFIKDFPNSQTAKKYRKGERIPGFKYPKKKKVKAEPPVNLKDMSAVSKPTKEVTIDDFKSTPTPPPTAKENIKSSYDPYDLVLDYVLSEGHASTVEEAHYVMMQMDEETIQTITEIKKRLIGGALLATPFVMQKIKDKFDPIGNERKKYQDALKKKYEKQSGTEGQGYFN